MAQVAGPARAGHHQFRHVVRAEIVKIVTLRSTAIIAGVTVVAGLLVTGLVTHAALHQPSGYYIGFDPTQDSLTGLIIAGLTGGVFGALLVTGEYSSGTIRATLAAVPRRPVVLAAKIGVATAAAVLFSETLSFVSFFLGETILAGGGAPSASLSSPGALRAVTLAGLCIALLALMAFGFGLAFRSTAAAIGAFVAVVFVLPLVLRGISERDLRFAPTSILTNSIMSTVAPGPGGILRPLSPPLGLALMVLYAAIAVVAGCLVFVRRDA